MSEDSGQTLIEVVVAFGTAVLVLAAVTVAVLSALQNAQFSKNQKLAENYAVEGIEIARHIRDANYDLFRGYVDINYCLDKGSSTFGPPNVFPPGCGQNVDIFVRQIDIEPNHVDCTTVSGTGTIKKVTSYVLWSDSKCSCNGVCLSGSLASDAEVGHNLYCHKSKISTCLSDIGVVPTP